jgi:p38 MAP kinase
MLVFDPRTRINATDALAHEYLAPYHDPTDEPVAAEVFDWSFNDADLPVDTWKVMMYSEILGAFWTAVAPCSAWVVRAETLRVRFRMQTSTTSVTSNLKQQKDLSPPSCLQTWLLD